MPSVPEPDAKPTRPEDSERLASVDLTAPANPSVLTKVAAPDLTVAEICTAVADQLDRARRDLAASRQRRDDLNDKIRAQVAHVEELERIHRSLNPAKRQSKSKKGA